MQVMAGAERGGAEGFFTRLVPALHRAGLKQRAVIRAHNTRGIELLDAGIDVAHLRFGGILDPFSKPRLKKMIADFDPDVVLSWMSRAASYCPAGGGRFVHCGRLGGYYNLKYYRTCDHLIGNTPDIVSYLVENGWPEERSPYLPNFVDARPAAPASRKDLFTPEDAVIVLGLGRLHTNKGFDVLLQAIAELPHVYLWLAGSGPMEAELKALAQSLGVAPRVRFLGWREDVAALFAASDVLVCSSRIEPLGNIVIEAWAHNTPVVAAAAKGPDFLIRDGENGLLAGIDDKTAIANAVHSIVTDPQLAGAIVAGGRQSYEADFTEQAVVKKYLAFFARVAG
jgi:glycosyltransferase involved in cell wall biosynthesis